VQTPAVQDLAHTRTSPLHWLATATAMAAVMALAGLLQPDDARAHQSAPRPAAPATPGGAPLPAPDPAAVTLPLECAGAPVEVVRSASGDLDGDGGPETVAAARCRAGSGTPPTGVYVLSRTRTGEARVVATLVAPAEQLGVAALTLGDGRVRATLLGYSSPEVPSCCPDLTERAEWRWQGGAFVRTSDRSGPASARV
jgi:hypothetical protein